MRRARKSPFSEEKLSHPLKLLRALAHPLRLKILEFIDKNKSVNVHKIYQSLYLEQSVTSQHLRLLREAGLVSTSRDGKYIFYSVDYKRIEETITAINNMAALGELYVEEDGDEGFEEE